MKRALWGARDDRFEHIYQSTKDGRRLGTFGHRTSAIEDLEALWAEAARTAEDHPELAAPARDAACREAVMW